MTLPEPISVLIADDHYLVRIGVRALLEKLPRYAVVGEAANAAEAMTSAATLNPSVVLLDIDMPDQSGLEVAARLQSLPVVPKVIILSALDTADAVLGALKAGSRGYLVKDLLLNELELALDSVSRGDLYISPRVSHHVIAASLSGQPPQAGRDLSSTGDQAPPILTERQSVVLTAIARGLSTKQIAREMDISPKTVEFHRSQIIERLGVRDVASLVRQAAKLGLVNLDE